LPIIKRSLEGIFGVANVRNTDWYGCALRLAVHANRPFSARQRLSEQVLDLTACDQAKPSKKLQHSDFHA
jgi:hypothetical protein